MKIGILIPTRDRPKFLSHALYLIENQSLTPDVIEIVDDKTDFDFPDVTWRYRTGIERLREKCDLIFCWEDDDWYHWDYLKTMLKIWEKSHKSDIIGLGNTIYYHIIERIYVKLDHPKRSSMMSMVLRSDVNINYCDDNYQFLDFYIWSNHQTAKRKVINTNKILNVGIKHNIGRVAGGGHSKLGIYKEIDPDGEFLKSIIKDKESLDFYEQIRNNNSKLQHSRFSSKIH